MLLILILRELIKLNTANFETVLQLTVRNELIFQTQQYNLQQQAQQQQQTNASKNAHNMSLLQLAIQTDSSFSSKVNIKREYGNIK